MVATEKSIVTASNKTNTAAKPTPTAASLKAPDAVAKLIPKVPVKHITKNVAPAITKAVVKAPAKAIHKATTKPMEKPVVQISLKPVVLQKEEKQAKAKKTKLVRDSFTIPKGEYAILDELKQRATHLNSAVKKSELIRAGIKSLATMTDTAFLAALKAVPTIKTGRPTKFKVD